MIGRTAVLLSLFLLFSGCTLSRHWVEYRTSQAVLHLEADGAQEVYLHTSLDGFRPHRAVRGKDGTWQAAVPARREFRYFFVVDGKTKTVDCDQMETDDFGSHNCIFSPRP